MEQGGSQRERIAKQFVPVTAKNGSELNADVSGAAYSEGVEPSTDSQLAKFVLIFRDLYVDSGPQRCFVVLLQSFVRDVFAAEFGNLSELDDVVGGVDELSNVAFQVSEESFQLFDWALIDLAAIL